MSAASLNELVASGAFVNEDVRKEKGIWTKEDGSIVEFEIFVKAEMSAADYEFIYLGVGDKTQEPTYMARRVHRLARMANGDQIPMETASKFKPDLLRAICDVLNKAEIDPPKA